MGIMILSVVLNVLITVPLALSFYLLADNPEMGGVESLKQSMRLMKGHIWQYLMLQLSFAPLLIVSLLFMGLPLLWVLPYMEASETAFYRDILGEFDESEKKEEALFTKIRHQTIIMQKHSYSADLFTGTKGDFYLWILFR